jgi:threonine aldolase
MPMTPVRVKDVAKGQFASDNNAGICPEALQAMLEADTAGHAPGYGDDRWTKAACDSMRALFETDCEVFFVFNGTAANALALAHLAQPYNAIICHAFAHIATDECSAPELFSGGAKLLTAAEPFQKLTPRMVEEVYRRRSDLHAPRPSALSVTQTTETGEVYSPEEIAGLAGAAHELGMRVHMDGARFANAVAALGVPPASLSWRAGIDVLSFGATKNGLPFGEAVVFFDRDLARDFDRRAKQAGQLASKMRYISAPWAAILENDVWLAHARHANAMGRRLSERLAKGKAVRIVAPTDANAVFAEIPPAAQKAVREKGWRYYTYIGESICRFMCAWDTTPETVDRFAAEVRKAVGAKG